MALKLKSPQRKPTVCENAPNGLRTSCRASYNQKRQSKVFIVVLAYYSTVWAALSPPRRASFLSGSVMHVGLHLWDHLTSHSWFAMSAKKQKRW